MAQILVSPKIDIRTIFGFTRKERKKMDFFKKKVLKIKSNLKFIRFIIYTRIFCVYFIQ